APRRQSSAPSRGLRIYLSSVVCVSGGTTVGSPELPQLDLPQPRPLVDATPLLNREMILDVGSSVKNGGAASSSPLSAICAGASIRVAVATPQHELPGALGVRLRVERGRWMRLARRGTDRLEGAAARECPLFELLDRTLHRRRVHARCLDDDVR